jgi:hypothetical protein
MSEQRYTESKTIFFAHDQVKAINDWRFATRKPSEAAAVRELVELGLEAAAAAERIAS